ncbi:WD repeat-containing protein 6 [Caerostris extrusa]|uniref:tRNA (34-2'-O)-methyltransferase regulator WDR6 n=1 Tax=Caerostris extrusa TaxID=172846 RepID=A0AAV4Y5Q9_CAEEX|nr:WD repeat-containing protein 6 [Caerostris extrusa]
MRIKCLLKLDTFPFEDELVFKNCSIHGIRIDDSNHVLLFGAKSVRIYVFCSSSTKWLVSVTKEFHLNDWIQDIQWLNNYTSTQKYFAAISAHNCLTLYDIDVTKTDVFQSSENCILYTASIVCNNFDAIVIAAGTVFKKIIFWSPQSISTENGKKPLIQSLSGHQGVIFSISYNKFHKLLSSTSDDRSIRLWKIHNHSMFNEDSLEFWENATIEIAHVLFAHESRVWMSVILQKCILSVGEDSHLCFWDLDGKLLRKKKCHKGECIAFTGGSDGGVYMWDVESAFTYGQISQISLHFRETSSNADFPRIISVLTDKMAGYFMVTTDKGWLSLFNIELKHWEDIYYDNAFASYCVSCISKGTLYLALGNISGELALLNLQECQLEKCRIKKFKIHNSKICSIHWVSDRNDYLLTCSIKGDMILWKVIFENKEFKIEGIQELFLPKCKHHWWSTAALFLQTQDYLIVGDRSGNISFYSQLHTDKKKSEENNVKVNPSMVHRYIHGDNGVTDIQLHKSLVYSAGRDGKIHLYDIDDNSLNLLHTIKVSHDLEWIGKMLFHGGDLLLLGFHTKDFMVWSSQLESAIMTVECGGGHRSWDFQLTDEGNATFVAIKKKDVIFTTENLQHVLNNKSILKTGISGQEFCCATYLFTKSQNSLDSVAVVACGGEDNTLRILGFIEGKGHQILSLCNLSGHLSSIKAISKFKLVEENAYLLASVGGRSQMMLWKIKEDPYVQGQQLASFILSGIGETTKHHKKENKCIQIDPQTRLMDVAISNFENHELSSGKYIISTACSDSYFRIYTFDINSRDLTLCCNLHHGEHCILRLSQILVMNYSRKVLFFATGATDGYIKVFNQKSCQYSDSISSNNLSPSLICPELQLKVHQSGVNALDAKSISDTDWIIGSAGDDTALSVTLIKFVNLPSGEIKCNELNRACENSAHASQITGIKILDEKHL